MFISQPININLLIVPTHKLNASPDTFAIHDHDQDSVSPHFGNHARYDNQEQNPVALFIASMPNISLA